MKLKVRTSLVLLGVLLSLTFVAYAAASSHRASSSITSVKLYRIDIAVEKAEQKVSVTALVRDERRAQARLTPCLTKAFVPIFEAVDAKSKSNALRALYALSAEAGVEYEMASIKPLMTPLLKGVRKMLTLPLPAALRSRLRGFLPTFAKVRSLNACADARRWFAAGLTRKREPRETARTTVALTEISKFAATTEGAEVGDLTPSQLRTRKLDEQRLDKHIKALGKQSDRSLKSWIAKLVRSVDHALHTTQTSTTATQTTPAGT